MLLANSAGSGWMRHEPDEGWLARAGERGAGQPSGDTDKVEGGCGKHVLEVDLRQTDVAGAAEMHAAHSLRECALNAGTRTVLGGVRLLGLTRSGGLECSMLRARAQRQETPGRAGAAGLEGAHLAMPAAL